MSPKYKKVLLKVSGEALSGANNFGLCTDTLASISNTLATVHNMGVNIVIVVGGGNFWRGRSGQTMDRTRADHMGMLATVINCLALQDALEKAGVQTRVQTAIEMRTIAEPYIRLKAERHLEKGRLVIFGCGTGNPFFSTDTAAALRAAELGCEAILLAKKVDAVYDSDPNSNPNAKKYDSIRYIDVINQGLGVMDTTATTMCMENKIPIIVFGINEPQNIIKALCGEKIGTIIEN